MAGESRTIVGISKSMGYNYNLDGTILALTYPSGRALNYAYDTAGRPLSAVDGSGAQYVTNTTYYPGGQELARGTDCTVKLVDGNTKFWGDNYGVACPEVANRRNAWGNLLSKTVTKCSAENVNLSVSALGNNQLSGYGYDAAGNMTSNVTTNQSYSYDPENRITGAAGFLYTYDAGGNRVEKANGTTGTLYWYMTPGIVAESDLSGNLQSDYVFFGGERVARIDLPGNTVHHFLSDHLHSTTLLVGPSGAIENESEYYPWGGERQFSNTVVNHYKFTGKERDSETNLSVRKRPFSEAECYNTHDFAWGRAGKASNHFAVHAV